MSSELKFPAQGADKEPENFCAVQGRATSRPGCSPWHLDFRGATAPSPMCKQSVMLSTCFLLGVGDLHTHQAEGAARPALGTEVLKGSPHGEISDVSTQRGAGEWRESS